MGSQRPHSTREASNDCGGKGDGVLKTFKRRHNGCIKQNVILKWKRN